MKKFKHSGATGDLIYGLAITRHFGGGEFYLHLNQMNWIGQHYYGSLPAPFHQDRLNQADFEYMREFMLAQPYISKFDVMDKDTEITHNLDKFRPLFVKHPGNYVDVYAEAFGIDDPDMCTMMRTTPWLSVPSAIRIEEHPVVINRTQRWLPPELSPIWKQWKEQGVDKTAVFVGLPEEYEAFKQQVGWDIPYYPTKTMLELAQIIAGAQMFVGNQSQALAMAIGLGVPFACEARRDLPAERNECYFPNQPNGSYF